MHSALTAYPTAIRDPFAIIRETHHSTVWQYRDPSVVGVRRSRIYHPNATEVLVRRANDVPLGK